MDVRTVAVVGRTGAGKSALVAALTGRRPADEGPTTQLQLAEVEHRGVRLALLDTPGHPELAGALVAGLRAADAVLFVVPAVGGLDPVTAQVFHRCEGRPRAIAITQLDQPGADSDEAIALCQRLLDDAVLPLQLPMHADDGAVAGLLSLLDLTVVEATGSRPADPEHRTLVAGLRDDLLETVLAEADDETLLDRYLDGALAGDEPEVLAALHTAVRRGDFSPAVVVSARSGVGVPQLLDLLVDAFPPPQDAPCPDVAHADGSPAEPLACDPDGPVAAEVVAPGVVRVWSGTLDGLPAGRTAHLVTTAPVGSTLSPDGLVLSPWDLPEPALPVAVAGEVAYDDPTVATSDDTGQQLLWFLGEQHAAVVLGSPALRVPLRVPTRGPDEQPWVAVAVEAPTVFARSIASDLVRRGGRVERPEPDPEDDEVSRVRAELPWSALEAWVPALATTSYGTARVVRGPLRWEPVSRP